MCPPGKGEGTRACTGRGFRRQTRPGRPEGKNFYTHTPARALRREGRPVRPWREAHSLSPCPDGQRLRLRTRKPDPIARVLHPRSDNTRCCPADSSWACPPGSRRIDVYSYKVPARPEAKSALQGRGTVAPAQWWWGHEVLKGPNTLAGVRIFRQNKQQRRARDCRCFPVLFLAARSAVVYRTCKVSAIADAPTTILADGPPPLQGGLLAVHLFLSCCCCLSFLQNIGCRRCPHHRAPHGPPPLQGGLLAVRYRWIEFLVGPFITPLHDWTVPAPYRDSFCPQLLHSFPNHPVDVLRYSGKILHHIQIGIP